MTSPELNHGEAKTILKSLNGLKVKKAK